MTEPASFLDAVRAVAAVTQAGCDPDCRWHLREAAQYLGATLAVPGVVDYLVAASRSADPKDPR